MIALKVIVKAIQLGINDMTVHLPNDTGDMTAQMDMIGTKDMKVR